MTCVKVSYPGRPQAKRALREAKAAAVRDRRRHGHASNRQEARTYRCPHCGFWHLTSLEEPPDE